MSEPEDRTERDDTATSRLRARYLEGDGRAGDRLAARVYGELLRRARGHAGLARLRRFVSPEDVVQEAIGRALLGARTNEWDFTVPGTFARFVRGVLDNTIRDQLRRAHTAKRAHGIRDVQPVDDLGAAAGGQACPSPSAELRFRELRELISRSLVPGREQDAWSLRHDEGLESPDIALRLGLTESTVRSLLHRARLRISEHIRSLFS